MSNPLEFLMKLKDMVSAPLQTMHSNGVQAYRRLEQAAGAFQRRNDQLPQSIAQIRQRLNELQQTREISVSRRQIQAADREIAQLEGRLRRLDRNANGGGFFSGGMGSMLRQGMAMAGIGGALALGGSMLTSGMNAEQQNIGFEVMLGSAQRAKLMISDIQKMAAATPFETKDLSNSTETLLGFGVAAKKVIPTMSMLGDVSRGNVDRFNSLTLAYAQVQAAGKMQGQDLLQMINAGFNPLQEISKRTGISLGDLKEKMEKGAISANMIELAFQSATSKGGQFYQMMDKQSMTTAGRLSTLKDNIGVMGKEIGTALLPFINTLIDSTNWMMQNKEIVITAGLAIGAYSLYTNAAAIATKIWTTGQWLLNAAMSANPIGLIIAGIVALGGIIYWAYNKFDWFRGGVMGAWEGLKQFGTLIKDYVIDRIKGLLTGIQGIGHALSLFFAGKFSESWEAAKQGAADLFGVTAAKNAYNNAYKVVDAGKQGYKKGMADFAAEKAKQKANTPGVEAAAPTAADFTAALNAGEGKGKKKKSSSGLSDSVDGVSGNAGRNITINITKFFDNIIVNTQTINEGIDNLEAKIEEAILRVVNSANTAG